MKLVPYLFTIPGVTAFLSQRICQDPLENIFGCQRQRGGTHDNPSVDEFIKNTQALCVVGSMCRSPALGNYRGGNDFDKYQYVCSTCTVNSFFLGFFAWG